MPRKMVDAWPLVPQRRHIQGKAIYEIQPDMPAPSIDYESTEVENNEGAEKVGTPQPNDTFVSKPTYCSTVGKVGKRFKGGGL